MLTVFTIGHSTRTWKAFLELLRAHGISGCDSLSTVYGLGKGVAQDAARVFTFAQRACDAGYAPGCDSLGIAYKYGEGVASDTARGLSLFQKACQMGMKEACDKTNPSR